MPPAGSGIDCPSRYHLIKQIFPKNAENRPKLTTIATMSGQLLRFRAANHRSIHQEVELTMVASKPAAKAFKNRARFFQSPAIKEPVSAAAVVYGANASGKTNLFHALRFMKNAVQRSYRSWSPEGGVPVVQFVHDPTSTESSYSVDLLLDGIRYEYGFRTSRANIVAEWIHVWPNGKKQQWLHRDKNEFHFSDKLQGHNKAIKDLTRDNALFLSAAAQNNHEQLRPLYHWFTTQLQVLFFGPSLSGRGIDSWWRRFVDEKDIKAREQILTLLRAADLGISDFRVREVEVEVEIPEEFRKMVEISGRAETLLQRLGKAILVEFKHCESWLSEASESTGTQHLLSLLPAIVNAQATGGVLCIDELNALHPMITIELLRMFQDFDLNPNHAQLLFNTHDVSLLGTALTPEPAVSRDQVWFTEKRPDGSTSLHSLHDYVVREHENLERGYFQGRYGGVPYPMFAKPTAAKATRPRTKSN